MSSSEREDLRNVALLACIMVAEAEGELIEFPAGEPRAPDERNATGDDPAGVDSEAAATVWLLAQAGVTLPEAAAYLRGERSAS